MHIALHIAIFVAGIILVLYFSEKLVEGTVGTSFGFGVSAFLISVIFIGFDPENLAVGAVASYEDVAGIALGSILGAAMVAIALAFGITAIIVPMKFKDSPKGVLFVPVGAVLLLGSLCFDGILSRIDGIILILGYILAVLCLAVLSKRGLEIRPSGEVAETLEEAGDLNRWKALGLLIVSLAAIVLGSELIVSGSKIIIAETGLSDTVFGMTLLALVVSIEELARELPAAMKGRPEISYGNVVGSILAFFLFNAGIISLVHPLPINDQTLYFYLPVCLGTVLVLTVFMLQKSISGWAGVILVLIYIIFFTWGYL